jgi:hypothetical protein
MPCFRSLHHSHLRPVVETKRDDGGPRSYDIWHGSRTTDFQAWFLIAAPFLLTRRPRKAISSDNASFESSAEYATVCPNTSDAGKR